MVSRPLSVIALAAALTGCSGETIKLFEPVEVKVIVPVKAEAPAELMAPYRAPDLPAFVAPSHPTAAFCLAPTAAASLKALTFDLLKRDAAWREWAATPLPVKP